jgi:hypothetical protein
VRDRPTDTGPQRRRTGDDQIVTQDGLFKGQSDRFFATVKRLAADADAAQRR